MKNFVKTIIGLFKKVNTFKEIFQVINVLGDVLDYASKKFAELDEQIED